MSDSIETAIVTLTPEVCAPGEDTPQEVVTLDFTVAAIRHAFEKEQFNLIDCRILVGRMVCAYIEQSKRGRAARLAELAEKVQEDDGILRDAYRIVCQFSGDALVKFKMLRTPEGKPLTYSHLAELSKLDTPSECEFHAAKAASEAWSYDRTRKEVKAVRKSKKNASSPATEGATTATGTISMPPFPQPPLLGAGGSSVGYSQVVAPSAPLPAWMMRLQGIEVEVFRLRQSLDAFVQEGGARELAAAPELADRLCGELEDLANQLDEVVAHVKAATSSGFGAPGNHQHEVAP